MKLLAHGKFISKNIFNLDITPKRLLDRFELELYISGTGFSVMDGIKYPHLKNRVIFAKPNQERFSIGSFECMYVHFQCNDIELISVLNSIPSFFCMNSYVETIDIMKKLNKADFRNKSAESLYKSGLLKELIAEILENSTTENVAADSVKIRNLEYILKTKDYIDNNYNKHITLDHLAKIALLSKNFYRKTFEEIIGMSPHKYLINVRISHAMEKLMNSNISIQEIAAQCGFESQSYMNYVFKRENNVTPSSFRR